jgi:hypothetical protein
MIFWQRLHGMRRIMKRVGILLIDMGPRLDHESIISNNKSSVVSNIRRMNAIMEDRINSIGIEVGVVVGECVVRDTSRL